jgi:hypothetical protein
MGGILIVIGVTAGTLQFVWPEGADRAYGVVRAGVVELEAALDPALPAVRLSGPGDVAALDSCDGSFVEMTSYGTEIIPVYAAHNNCGGDEIHPWGVGQRVHVEGQTDTFVVVDVRDTPKKWVTTDALIGLDGSFALQTCYYGENRMKFVALEPAGAVSAQGGMTTPGSAP